MTDFLIENLPFGVIAPGWIGVAFEDRILDLRRCAASDLLPGSVKEASAEPTLNALMSLAKPHRVELRECIQAILRTGRGPLINEAAMIEALQTGQLGGVGLDVYDREPLPMEHPLRRLDNAILMSHRGYATVEVLSERYEQAMSNILDYLDGKSMTLLNPQVVNR